jgi:hypothetical protein
VLFSRHGALCTAAGDLRRSRRSAGASRRRDHRRRALHVAATSSTSRARGQQTARIAARSLRSRTRRPCGWRIPFELELHFGRRARSRHRGASTRVKGSPTRGCSPSVVMWSISLRWEDVVYEPGTLRVVTYRNGREWAVAEMRTTGAAAKLALTPDRREIRADDTDLVFVTLSVQDKDGRSVPRANDQVRFSIETRSHRGHRQWRPDEFRTVPVARPSRLQRARARHRARDPRRTAKHQN